MSARICKGLLGMAIPGYGSILGNEAEVQTFLL